MKMIATTAISGVHEVTEFESNVEIMSQKDFLKSLSSLKDGEIIGCDASSEYVVLVDKEYGIQFID